MWSVQYRESAHADLAADAEWHEQHLGTGAGLRFLRAVLDVVDRIAERHHAFPVWGIDPRYRRAVVPAVPYVVFFSVDRVTTSITIEAIAHTSRDPAFWRDR